MPTDQTPVPTLQDHLSEPLRVGAPDVHGPLAVFPVFGPPPASTTCPSPRPVARRGDQGARGGASVNDLLVVNGGSSAVLLYEGEEVLGAQQNRTFDVSVLVPAGATLACP